MRNNAITKIDRLSRMSDARMWIIYYFNVEVNLCISYRSLCILHTRDCILWDIYHIVLFIIIRKSAFFFKFVLYTVTWVRYKNIYFGFWLIHFFSVICLKNLESCITLCYNYKIKKYSIIITCNYINCRLISFFIHITRILILSKMCTELKSASNFPVDYINAAF